MTRNASSATKHVGKQFAVDDFGPRNFGKLGQIFWVLDQDGLIQPANKLGCGIYRNDTRHMSIWTWLCNGKSLAPLSVSAQEGYGAHAVYANRESEHNDCKLSRQDIKIDRDIVIHADGIFERLRLTSFHPSRASFKMDLVLAQDAADVFHVRNCAFHTRGKMKAPQVHQSRERTAVLFSYKGVDDYFVETAVGFLGKQPQAVTMSRTRVGNEEKIPTATASFEVELDVHETIEIEVQIRPFEENKQSLSGGNKATSRTAVLNTISQLLFEQAHTAADEAYAAWRANSVSVETGNALVNSALERAYLDLYMLRHPTKHGEIVAAGIPWYVAPFGRDSAITARQVLTFIPSIARGVIETLAGFQSKEDDIKRVAFVGKIMHELHVGELTRAGILPYTPFFGTSDATPLWLILLADYVLATGDHDFLARLMPNVEAALSYLNMETARGGGYIRYGFDVNQTLGNQGWKDSGNCIVRRDGSLAVGPIALCEVQSYLYEAWSKLAQVFDRSGNKDLALELRGRAVTLKASFEKDFWMEDQKFIAMAVDALGQVDEIGSNAGHCLASGILSPEQAKAVVKELTSPGLLCKWGIRTLSATARAYNPMGYHLGTVWPHDVAMIVSGMIAAGFTSEAHTVWSTFENLLKEQPDHRLPELVCGFGEGPVVGYPAACSPQAWDTGCLFQMLAAYAGLTLDESTKTVYVKNAALPPSLEYLVLKGVRVGDGVVDLRYKVGDTGVLVEAKLEGGVHLVIN
jgi:glycogen debranching enzyme